jgi:hypothetical protein
MIAEHELAFIIACKSENPLKAVRECYEEHYLKTDIKDKDGVITNILAKICEKYCEYSVTQLVNDLCPDNNWNSHNDDYWLNALERLINKICFTKSSDFGPEVHFWYETNRAINSRVSEQTSKKSGKYD